MKVETQIRVKWNKCDEVLPVHGQYVYVIHKTNDNVIFPEFYKFNSQKHNYSNKQSSRSLYFEDLDCCLPNNLDLKDVLYWIDSHELKIEISATKLLSILGIHEG